MSKLIYSWVGASAPLISRELKIAAPESPIAAIISIGVLIVGEYATTLGILELAVLEAVEQSVEVVKALVLTDDAGVLTILVTLVLKLTVKSRS